MTTELTPQLKAKIPDLIKILNNTSYVKGRDLASALNTSERQLRLIVSYARKNVSPLICSGDSGYWIESDIEAVRRSIQRTRAHAYSEIEVCNKQEKLLKEEFL